MRKQNILEIMFGEAFENNLADSTINETYDKSFREAIDNVLATLTPREEKVLKMRFGLGNIGLDYTLEEVGQHFAVTRERIRQIENKALRKLRHPARLRILKDFLEREVDEIEEKNLKIELSDVIEKIRTLTPDLILHLKKHIIDLQKLHWKVFEHLVAEFLTSQGFSQIRLVGQNPTTSADIFATYLIDKAGIEQRFFIEVKRWKDTLGIEEIQRVAGAMYLEKEIWGWSAAMIVAVGGYKNFNKFTPRDLEMKGILLKDKKNVEEWLEDYEFNNCGLYLSEPINLKK